MADIARLGLAVDSSQVEHGTATLTQLTGAAGTAERAVRGLAGAGQAEAAGMKVATAATEANTAALRANEAANKMAGFQRRNLIFQLNDIGVSLASGMNPLMVAVQQGSQIATIYEGGVVPALRATAVMAAEAAAAFWPIAVAVGVVVAVIAGLTYEINKTADVQVSFFDVALAGWQLFAEGVTALVSPIWDLFVSGLKWVWDTTAPMLKWLGNAIIAPWALGVKAIGTLWSGLPAAIGDVMITTANVIVKGVEYSINKAAELLDNFIGKANEGLAMMPGGLSIPSVGRVDFGGAANPYAGALGQLGSNLTADSVAANQTDYMGNMFGAISGKAQEIAAARQEAEKLGDAASGANEKVKKLAEDGLSKVGEFGKSVLSTLSSGFADMFKGLLRGTTSVTDAIGGLLGKLGDLFIDQAFNMLFSSAGASGGVGGGIGGWIAGLLGFASGGVFSAGHQVQAFAKGGVVSSPTLFPMANGAGLMGEAGPEAIMPLRRGADGRLGVAAANQKQSNDNRPVSITVQVVGARGNAEIQQMVAAGVSSGLKSYDKQLPAKMRDISQRYN